MRNKLSVLLLSVFVLSFANFSFAMRRQENIDEFLKEMEREEKDPFYDPFDTRDFNYCLSEEDLFVLMKTFLGWHDSGFFEAVKEGLYKVEDFKSVLGIEKEELARIESWKKRTNLTDKRPLYLGALDGTDGIYRYVNYIHMLCEKYAKTKHKDQFIKNVASHFVKFMRYIAFYYSKHNPKQGYTEIVSAVFFADIFKLWAMGVNREQFANIVASSKAYQLMLPLGQYLKKLKEHCPDILRNLQIPGEQELLGPIARGKKNVPNMQNIQSNNSPRDMRRPNVSQSMGHGENRRRRKDNSSDPRKKRRKHHMNQMRQMQSNRGPSRKKMQNSQMISPLSPMMMGGNIGTMGGMQNQRSNISRRRQGSFTGNRRHTQNTNNTNVSPPPPMQQNQKRMREKTPEKNQTPLPQPIRVDRQPPLQNLNIPLQSIGGIYKKVRDAQEENPVVSLFGSGNSMTSFNPLPMRNLPQQQPSRSIFGGNRNNQRGNMPPPPMRNRMRNGNGGSDIVGPPMSNDTQRVNPVCMSQQLPPRPSCCGNGNQCRHMPSPPPQRNYMRNGNGGSNIVGPPMSNGPIRVNPMGMPSQNRSIGGIYQKTKKNEPVVSLFGSTFNPSFNPSQMNMPPQQPPRSLFNGNGSNRCDPIPPPPIRNRRSNGNRNRERLSMSNGPQIINPTVCPSSFGQKKKSSSPRKKKKRNRLRRKKRNNF